MTKSKRITNSLGSVVSTIEMDPWGADTTRSNNAAFQPKKFTSYERDGNGAASSLGNEPRALVTFRSDNNHEINRGAASEVLEEFDSRLAHAI